MRIIRTAIAALASALLASTVFAQGYPAKPVKITVPFTPGSATDIIARTVAEKLGSNLGQTFIVENRPGAGGTIGAGQVAKADPDGYSVLVHSGAHAVNPAIYPNLPYDTLKDFAAVAGLAGLPNVLVVSPAKDYKSVKDLVAAAKAKPGTLNYGSAGNGSSTHMNAEKFRLMAGFDAVHVPYKGTPEAMTDTVTGRIDFFFAPVVSALPLIKDGKLMPLAVGTARRSPVLPDVPTTIEAGVPGSDFILWVGMLAPAKTPREIITKLNQEAQKALQSADVRERFAKLGAEPMEMTPEQLEAFIREDIAVSAKIAKAAGLKP